MDSDMKRDCVYGDPLIPDAANVNITPVTLPVSSSAASTPLQYILSRRALYASGRILVPLVYRLSTQVAYRELVEIM
jgi:hypothetical protein